jgi:hypothetical protein
LLGRASAGEDHGLCGTLRERAARRLPKSSGHVGTVRGLFRLGEAQSLCAISAGSVDFAEFFLERAKGFEPSTPTLARSFLGFAAVRSKLLSFAKCKDFNSF